MVTLLFARRLSVRLNLMKLPSFQVRKAEY